MRRYRAEFHLNRRADAAPLAALLLMPFAISGAERRDAPAPHRLSLSVTREPLGKVLQEIRAKTGIAVEARSELLELPVSVSLRDVPFWQVLDGVAAAADARVELYGRAGRPGLVPRAGAGGTPVSYDGLFRCSLKRMVAARDFETGTHGCTAQVEVAWEPTLEPLLLDGHPRQLVLKDAGRKTIPVTDEGGTLAPVDGKLALVVDAALPALPRTVDRIGLLEGRLTAVAPGKMVTLSFGPLSQLSAAPADSPLRRKAVDGMSCAVSSVRIRSDSCTIQVTIDLPSGGPSLESYQSWVVNNAMYLEAPAQVRVPAASYVLEASTPRHAVVSYHFTGKEARAALGRPAQWSVVYRTPTSLVELPVRFSFKDVPLP
jgi:hypothetical protein